MVDTYLVALIQTMLLISVYVMRMQNLMDILKKSLDTDYRLSLLIFAKKMHVRI